MSGVTSPVTGARNALGQFRGEMALQRALADQSGQSISRLASVGAAFETSTLRSVSAIRSWRDDVRTLSAAADGAGRPISTLAANFGVLEERSRTVGGMASVFRTVSGAVSDFGDRAGAALGTASAAPSTSGSPRSAGSPAWSPARAPAWARGCSAAPGR